MAKPLNASFLYLLSGLTVDPHTKKVKRYVGHSFMAIDNLKFIAYISIINEKKNRITLEYESTLVNLFAALWNFDIKMMQKKPSKSSMGQNLKEGPSIYVR